MTLPTRSAIVVLAPQWPGSSAGGGPRWGEFFFGGGQQLAAFAGALFGQHGVVAAHQPLAGRNCGELISNRSCSSNSDSCRAPVCDDGLDLGGAQRADPSSCAGRTSSRIAGVGEHAPIADQTHPRQTEPLLELADLGVPGCSGLGVALEHLDRDRDAAVVHSSP